MVKTGSIEVACGGAKRARITTGDSKATTIAALNIIIILDLVIIIYLA